LEEYTKTLEVKVERRTGALVESKRLLKEKEEKTRESLKLLTTIAELTTRSTQASEIFPNVLRQALSTVPACGGALYLLLDNPSRLEMQWSENAPSLPPIVEVDPEQFRSEPSEQEKSPLCESFLEKLRAPSLLDSHNDLAVPLCCRGRMLGMLVFTEIDLDAVTPEIQDMLLSTGQQVGITIESLQNTEGLRRSSELLQTVFDGITDMLVLLDRDLCIRMVNRAHIRRFGPAPNGKNPEGGCRSPNACAACPFVQCGVEAVFRTRKPMIEELMSRNGDIYLVHYYPILDEKGEVASIVRYAKDITAQKRVDQKIQQTEKLAAVGQLASGIAHEINNPLGVILCHTELLDQQLDGLSDARNDLATIEKHALSCRRIVSDLLKFARSQGSSWQLAPLNRTIEEVVAIISHQFRRQQVEIHLDLAPDIPLMNLDVDKFKQVCMNLLINARQAIQGKGEVRVTTRYLESENCAQILFRDNGGGIPPEILERIFDPFFTTKKTGEGTGLGLSVSFGIIKDHGGDIQVRSEQGRFTQFTITLPLDWTGVGESHE
jgi:signal transduction histidine kinase